ncbi:hypothetical protein AC578_588 [Pseudocercospora eumusae]|uniref:Uncharacterized protein n=1 Tax=Pseudocercospora eumusae TaxID=321146 RepID=A0A139HYD5_9PEZI|nr:hypothetical protein AC578_588 [Pseudocercospora eumusae]
MSSVAQSMAEFTVMYTAEYWQCPSATCEQLQCSGCTFFAQSSSRHDNVDAVSCCDNAHVPESLRALLFDTQISVFFFAQTTLTSTPPNRCITFAALSGSTEISHLQILQVGPELKWTALWTACSHNSPKIADKIKLKMGRKSSRTLRQQLGQIMDGPYSPDAQAITSTSIVDATATPLPEESDRQTLSPRLPKRFGTASGSDEAAQLHHPRPAIYSPSVYSRSVSRVDGEKPRAGKSTMNRLMRPNSDFFGLAYRMILPRKPSISTAGNRHSRHNSRHLSASTDSTITRRLEESNFDGTYDSLYDPACYQDLSDIRLDPANPEVSMTNADKHAKFQDHKRQISEHKERV